MDLAETRFASKDGVDLRNGGGTLLLDSSMTRAENSELCVGPGHAGVILAEDSSTDTGMGALRYLIDRLEPPKGGFRCMDRSNIVETYLGRNYSKLGTLSLP